MYLTNSRNNEIFAFLRVNLLKKSRHEFKKLREKLGVCDDFAKYITKEIQTH